ncbi:MAG: type III pantothenate kinase [Candidatus Marinamargulisbacteria bacterium]|jgi:type III pantothenate kinase
MLSPKAQQKDFLIDVGNSTTVFAESDGACFGPVRRLPTVSFESEFGDMGLDGFSRVVVSSVVPRVDGLLVKYPNVLHVNYLNIPDLSINMPNPEQIGADRLVNGLAAFTKTGKSCLIVDSGTATTFCYVDKHGIYQGGSIVPGMRISSQALNNHTAKLPLIYVSTQTDVLGKSTEEALEKGLFFGFIHLINGVIAEYKKVDKDLVVVGTGSGLSVLHPSLNIDAHVPDLIMQGLFICSKKLDPVTQKTI